MKLLFVSLGCDKNLVDTEHMLSRLVKHDFVLTDDENEADVIVVNTCCFISDAMEESINTLIELGQLKEAGNLKVLVACGCLAQRYAEDIRNEIPEVDAIVGTNSYDEIVEAINNSLSGDNREYMKSLEGLPDNSEGRFVTTGGHYAHLKIAEGCDKHCTYCVIPSIRGNYRSVPMEDIIAEATKLAAGGVSELILVAQETTLYGTDLYGRKALPELLNKLSEIDGIHWIRLQYCYPEEITEEIIDVMASNPKVCHYIDMPIQHCDDEILGRMGRKTNEADIRNIVKALREKMPDICIRTTLICGFPGETEEAFEKLLKFIEDMKFDRLGSFPYSRQENTPAAEFDNQIPEEVKLQRVDKVMQLQQQISMEVNESFIGKELEVFVVGKIPEDGVFVARSFRDAPDVDGFVFINSHRELVSGEYVKVLITGAHEYDLVGELL
jgi:ribosomal protein S12 methylthiotransferase